MKIPINIYLEFNGKELNGWIAPVDDKKQPPIEFMVVLEERFAGYLKKGEVWHWDQHPELSEQLAEFVQAWYG